MRNIFMLYMPPTNHEAIVHYEDTIKQRVPLERIARFLSTDLISQLKEVFGDRPIAIWGSRNSDANRRRFDQMEPRDDILIVEGETIRLLGLIAAKTINPDLSRELWKNLQGGETAGWDLIYFIANPKEIDLPFSAFCRLIGYRENYRLQGFSSVSAALRDEFYGKYEDLYDVLVRLKQGQDIRKKDTLTVTPLPDPRVEDAATELTTEDVDEVLRSKEISEHIRMQWVIARLGLKAGEKIWAPRGDQTRIKKIYNFDKFETHFATGIDLPAGFFREIDVVWKEQFRIDAAFEVENSTAIYSGLLRFADLSIVAPNTIYPLFLVAPKERREQVRKQLERPAFEKLNLRPKVRFLPYEAIDDIDQFFKDSNTGPSVDLIRSKAEVLA